MNKISTVISRGERADFSNTWKVIGDFFSDEAASQRANSSVHVPPKAQYRCAIRMTEAQAWHIEHIGASFQLSDFSNTSENNFVILGEGAFSKDNIKEKVFEWHQSEATAIAEEIIQHYFIVVPRRALASYSDLLPVREWISHLLASVCNKVLVRAKVKEKTEIVSEFEKIASAACIEFCNSHGLIPDLRNCLDRAKLAFSNRQSLSAEYDRFDQDEYEEDGHVVIRLEVSSDQETAFKEYDAWVDWTVDNIKPNNIGRFTLTIRRV